MNTGFKYGRNKVTALETLKEVVYKGRTYRVVRVNIEGAGEYITYRLYNAKGRFIKQFMMEPVVYKMLCHWG